MTAKLVAAVTATTAAKSGASSLAIILPSTVRAGDVAVLLIGCTGAASNPPVAPAGWTATDPTTVGTALGTWLVCSRALTAADAGTTVTATMTGTGARMVAAGSVWRGTDGTVTVATPVTVTGTAAAGTTTVTGPAVTPVEAGDVILALAGSHSAGSPFDAGLASSTVGWTDDGSTVTTYPSAANMGADATHLTAPSTSTVTGPTWTGNQADNWYATTVLLKVTAPAAPTTTLPRRLPGTEEFALYIDRTHSIVLKPRSIVVAAGAPAVREVPPHWYYDDGTGQQTVGDSTWHIAGLTGGGFQNVVAQSRTTTSDGSRVMWSGADVAGALRSLDKLTWTPRNVGLGSLHVAAILPHPTDATRAWLLADTGLFRTVNTGDRWTKGGLPADARGNGDSLSGIGNREHPRDTGRLIAVDADASHLWVAGYSTGVRMSTDGGVSQSGGTLFAADHVQAIVWDPNSPDQLYVAVHNYNDPAATASRSGVWRITDATTGMSTAVKVGDWQGTASSTIGPIELVLDDNGGASTLIAVADTAGVFYITSPGTRAGAAAWTAWNTGLPVGSTLGWESIDARRTSTGQLEVSVGAAGITGSPARTADYVYVSASYGAAWTPITDAAHVTVSYVELGTERAAFIGTQAYLGLGHGNDWVSASLRYDRDDPGTLYSAGRGGVWRFQRTPTATKPWAARPMTAGLAVTVNMWVAGCPVPPGSTAAAVAGRFVVGSMDYSANGTTDGALTFSPTGLRVAANPTTTSDAGCYDDSPKSGELPGLAAGCSLRGPSTVSPQNGVYESPDPLAPNATWAYLPFPVGSWARPSALSGQATSNPATDTFTLTAHGLSVGDPVAVQSGPTGLGPAGVYFVQAVPSASTFQLASSPSGPAVTFTGSQPLVTITGSPDVGGVWKGRNGAGGDPVRLAVTQGAGVWRKQGTAAWTRVLDLGVPPGSPVVAYFRGKPQSSTVYGHVGGAVWRSDDAGLSWTKLLTGIGNGYARYDTLCIDPLNSAVLYVSAGAGGVVRIDNASTSTGTASTRTTNLTGAAVGWIAYDPTTNALYAQGTSPVALYRWAKPASDTTNVDVSDQLFRDNCGTTRSAGFSSDGVLLACDNGQGAYWSKPGQANTGGSGTGGSPGGSPTMPTVGVPGKVVWGGINSTTAAGLSWTAWNSLLQTTTGVGRVYAQHLDGSGPDGTGDVVAAQVAPILAAGAFVVFSFLAGGVGSATTFDWSWSDIADPNTPNRAAIDAQLDTLIGRLKKLPVAHLRRLLLCLNHEPENDGTGQGTKDGLGTSATAVALRAAYRRAFRYVMRRLRAAGIPCPYGIILISDTPGSTTKPWYWWNPDLDDDLKLLPATAWEPCAYWGVDGYVPKLTGGLAATDSLPTFATVAAKYHDAQQSAVDAGKAGAVRPVIVPELGVAESGYTSPYAAPPNGTHYTFPALANGPGTASPYLASDFQRDMIAGAVAAGWALVCTWASGDYRQDASSIRTTSARGIFTDTTTYPNLWQVGQPLDGTTATPPTGLTYTATDGETFTLSGDPSVLTTDSAAGTFTATTGEVVIASDPTFTYDDATGRWVYTPGSTA